VNRLGGELARRVKGVEICLKIESMLVSVSVILEEDADAVRDIGWPMSTE
jgi:hypothetical protein